MAQARRAATQACGAVAELVIQARRAVTQARRAVTQALRAVTQVPCNSGALCCALRLAEL